MVTTTILVYHIATCLCWWWKRVGIPIYIPLSIKKKKYLWHIWPSLQTLRQIGVSPQQTHSCIVNHFEPQHDWVCSEWINSAWMVHHCWPHLTQTTQRPNDQMTSKINLSIHLEVVLRLDLFLLLEVFLRLSQGSLVQRPVANWSCGDWPKLKRPRSTVLFVMLKKNRVVWIPEVSCPHKKKR